MMDYQEAINTLKDEIKCSCYRNRGYCRICTIYSKMDRDNIIDACKCAISAMQELQIYKDNEKRNLSRTDRLMDECAYRHENGNCLKVGGFCTSVPLSHCQRYKDWYTDYRGYKKLGTLEEVREAVEKQKAKKPIIQPWSPARCPTCGEELSENLGDGYYRHRTFLERCTNVECAQRLDWSEEE